MTQLVLSLGSNIEREKHIRFAVDELRRCFGDLRVSPVYENAAVGFDGADFYNLVVVTGTDLPLEAVIEKLQAIEAAAGRIRGAKRFEDRSLDIDILLFGAADLHPQGFNIPRDEIAHAAYVLRPLADLLPQQRHPVSGESFAAMSRAFAGEQADLRRVELNLAPVCAE